ncbi:MAG: MFS transporter, partial [Chloroflexi bacterium]|nr:MFS transporter [Chloroflexota bacterium]
LYLLVQGPYMLLVLRFVHGFATAIFSPVASAAVADLFQYERGEKLGWFASANEVGSAFGPLLGGLILAALVGHGLFKFQVIYLVVGGIGVFTLWLALRLPIGLAPPKPPPLTVAADPTVGRWKQFTRGMGEVLNNRPILIASSVESAMFLGVGALLGFLPLYARNIVGLGDVHLGVLIWMPLVMAMVGKPISGRISDRIGRKPVILMGLGLCTGMLPLVPLTTHFMALLAEGALFGLGMAIVTPSTNALVADLCKAGNYGAAMGIFGTIWDVGEASGPILAGALIALYGDLQSASAYLAAFGIVAVPLVIAGLAFAIVVREPQTGLQQA